MLTEFRKGLVVLDCRPFFNFGVTCEKQCVGERHVSACRFCIDLRTGRLTHAARLNNSRQEGHRGNEDLSAPQLLHRNHENGLHKMQNRLCRRFKESTDCPCVDSGIVELFVEQMLLFG